MHIPRPEPGPDAYVIDTAYADLVRWLETSVPPPHSPTFQLVSTTPPVTTTDIYGPDLARDAYGNSIGAIRLPDEQVPIATNTGSNAGPGTCFLNGGYIPFTSAQLATLYPTNQDYLSKFAAAALAVYKQGFLLQRDLTLDLDNAQTSSVPRTDGTLFLCSTTGRPATLTRRRSNPKIRSAT